MGIKISGVNMKKSIWWLMIIPLICVIGNSTKPSYSKPIPQYQETEPETFETVFEIRDPKYRLIAEVIAAEACGEGWEGMIRVANVIDNRAKAWHKTHYEIITQKSQFAGLKHPHRTKIYNQCDIDANTIAIHMLRGNLVDQTNGALYFENVKAYGMPKWARGKKITHKYNKHIFFK